LTVGHRWESSVELTLKVVFQSEGGAARGVYFLARGIGIVLDLAEHRGTRFRFALLSFRDGTSVSR
jgi:hypothetical protein